MSLIKASFLNELKPVKELIEHVHEYLHLPRDTENAKKRDREDRDATVQSPVRDQRIFTEQKATDEEEEGIAESRTVSPPPETVFSGEETIPDAVWDRAIKKMDPPLASKLSKAGFRVSGNKLVLTLNGGYSVFMDSIKKNAVLIEEIFSGELGQDVRLHIETVKGTAVPKKELKENMLADPAIQEVLELFNGSRVVDVIPIKQDEE
jgi:hypothetical protein